jgi:hypothetical protein
MALADDGKITDNEAVSKLKAIGSRSSPIKMQLFENEPVIKFQISRLTDKILGTKY